MHEKGLTYKTIANKYNTSASTIGRLLRSNGYNSRGKITTQNLPQIIEEYHNGCSLKQIAKKYKVSESTLSNKLKSEGIHILEPSEMNHKYSLNQHYFDNIDTSNKAYILGLLYADGCNTGRSITISLQEKDKEILNKINLEFESNRPLYFKNYRKKNIKHQNQYSLTIVNKHFTEQLNKWGVIPRKSLKITFPLWLQKELIPHFIRGYFDGDGCIPNNIKEMRVTLISTEKFCEVLSVHLKEKLNIHCSISYCHNNANSPTRELRISGKKQTQKFLEYIYKDAELFFERKYDLFLSKYK